MKSYKSIDEYIDGQPERFISVLTKIRQALNKALPEAEEVISYNMPVLKYRRILVYYAATKSHLGFYPTPSGISAFKQELKKYKQGKGSVQFPWEEIPLDLIVQIARFRFEEEKANKFGTD